MQVCRFSYRYTHSIRSLSLPALWKNCEIAKTRNQTGTPVSLQLLTASQWKSLSWNAMEQIAKLFMLKLGDFEACNQKQTDVADALFVIKNLVPDRYKMKANLPRPDKFDIPSYLKKNQFPSEKSCVSGYAEYTLPMAENEQPTSSNHLEFEQAIHVACCNPS